MLQDLLKDIQFAQKMIAKQHPDIQKWNEWPKELGVGRITTVIISQKTASGWQGFCKGHPVSSTVLVVPCAISG